MSKEIYISTTPHETRLAIVEDEQLAEIYYERENEYTLAGSIYNGKVTRVLPGMQSSFVDIGLERDAFLYVTDFMEEAGDTADFEDGGGARRSSSRDEGSGDRGGRGRGRGRGGDRDRGGRDSRPAPQGVDQSDASSFDEPVAPAPVEGVGSVDSDGEGGSRRWRGRRGRRRGRGTRDEQPVAGDSVSIEGGYDGETVVIDSMDAEEGDGAIAIDLDAETSAPAERSDRGGRDRGGRDRGGRGGRGRGRDGRGGGRDRDRAPRESSPVAEAAPFDNSYAGYYDDTALPEPTGEPILLPGESIRKYRDPAEVAAEEAEAQRNAPPVREVLVVSAPSIEIVGWDGGAVLPGETIRPRNREAGADDDRGSERSERGSERGGRERGGRDRGGRGRDDRGRGRDREERAPRTTFAPDETVVIASDDFEEEQQVSESASQQVSDAVLPEAVVEPVAAETVSIESEEPVEYEPTEGASAALTDTTRRDLRRFEQEPEEVAAAPDATTYDLNVDAGEPTEPLATAVQAEDVAAPIQAVEMEGVTGDDEPEFTTLQASGEMLSVHVEEAGDEPGIPLTGQDTASVAHPVEISEAVQSVTLSEAETLPQPIVIGDETVEEEIQPEIHAYGDGDFHEEEIEELEGDEYEYEAVSSTDEESEEYEEETLEGSTDLGSMLHEMTLDGQTGSEDDDFADASGGFTEEDFGGEPDEEEDAPAEVSTSNNGEQRQRSERGGDRGRGRGGRDRDRRGGRNSGGDRGRGRGRQSVQTQDLPAINELLKPGQEILVQIAKEPIAKKGARITSHIALPGRFLVFMPTVNHTGVSRKISSDEERRRLKSILLSEKGDATGGFIVRTAADGASEEELRTDLRFLIQMWNDIKQRSETSKSPALIYHDLNLVERILRDQVTDNFSAIWVDTEQEYERVLRFLQRFQPSLVRRVKLYTKETPLFEHFGVTQEIDKALKSKVWLKSGGSIVINQTEALVAIDINTGKYVGKTARLEDTIVKTNLDAIPEIVRQIRLRDLGGIIVIDFIDMDDRKNRAKVLQALEDEMRADRAPSKILPFNDFGLVIMTRKRVKQSLERTLCIPDPVTEGTGMIKSPVTVANEIYIEMRKMHRHFEKTDVMLRVHPEVVKTLKLNGAKRLQELEDMTRKTILLKSDPSLSPEAFDIH